MRQVGRDELAYAVVTALRKVSAATLQRLGDRRPDQRRAAQAAIALTVADGLGRFEIICDRELPLMGEATFERPIARMLGVDVPSGVIPARDDGPCEPSD